MSEEILSKEELYELKLIMSDERAAGPFTGMITNIVANNNIEINTAIRLALTVRIAAKKLAGNWVKPQ